MTKLILAGAALMSTLLTTATVAQTNSPCLQGNQIFAASPMDDRTLIVNDRANRTYVVRLRGACNGLLTTSPLRITINSATNQACLGPNDRIAFRHHTVGRNTCFVEEVSTDLVSIASIASINRPFSRVY